MTISASYSADTYAGNGSTTVFAVTFAFLSTATNLKVSIKVDSTGVITTQTLTTHYTVSGSNVTMLTAPASGETLIIELSPDFQQTSDYSENSAFPAETLETDLDERCLEGQINNDAVGRSLKLDADLASSVDTTIVATSTAGLAGKLIQANATGTGFGVVDAASLGVIAVPVPVASGGTGATSESAALTALGGIGAATTDTLTNKTINLTSNTLSGTTAQFNTALSDGSFATLAGTETLTNKTIDTASNTITIVEADISDLQTYATAASTTTFTNKTFDANGTGNSISNIDVADLANGTDGELITWNASGQPATVAVGTAGHVLTSNGAGAPPTFQASSSGGAWTLLSSATPSSAASVDFTGLSSTYAAYMIVYTDMAPATDNVSLLVRTDSDGGASFDSGASDYSYVQQRTAATIALAADTGHTDIVVATECGNNTNESISGYIIVYDPSSSNYTRITSQSCGMVATGSDRLFIAAGQRLSTTAVDAVQILYSSGNIASGEVRLYGLTNA